MTVKITYSKKFAPSFQGGRQSLKAIGKSLAHLVRYRVDKEGQASDGSRLPLVSGGKWWFTSAADPRKFPEMVPRHRRGDRRKDASLKVHLKGYAAMKRKMTGKVPQRGRSLTGRMWKSLAVSITGNMKKNRIKVYFAGQERVGLDFKNTTRKGRPKAISFRHRDKARLLQYANRKKGGGPPAERGRPDFLIMGISKNELQVTRDMWLSKLKLLK